MSEKENAPIVVQLEATKPVSVKLVEKPRSKPKLPSQVMREAISQLWSDPWIKGVFGVSAIVVMLGGLLSMHRVFHKSFDRPNRTLTIQHVV